MKRLNWKLLLKLVEKYKDEAELCLNFGAYYAGLVCMRAALEAILYARFLCELNIKITDNTVKIPEIAKLSELIYQAYEDGLLTKHGFEAAERIRRYGNKIHCTQVAGGKRLPSISKRNLKARLNDLEIVVKDLLKSL